jgi:DNA-binding LytR/AlgR family response regulator
MPAIQLLIVEDDFLISEEIKSCVLALGFEVSSIVDNGKDAIQEVLKSKPDLAIMDIRIKGELDGIETAGQLAKDFDIPIIYLTDQQDKATFERAKSTKPHAFLSKPFTNLSLQRSIELAIVQDYKDQKSNQSNSLNSGAILNKHFMLKNKDGLHSITLEDITYLKADQQYCYLFTRDNEWHISRAMVKIIESLHQAEYCKNNLIRISKSHCINLQKISKISGNKVTVESQDFTFGEKYRELLYEHIQTI